MRTPAGMSTRSRLLHGLLADPRVDRTIALITSLPAAYLVYFRLRHGGLDMVRVHLILQSLLFVVTMIVRRPPVRVTLDPSLWILTFVATYWITLAALAAAAGAPIAPHGVILSLSWLGLLITIYARLSLGRNIGFVPAQRHIVTTGAYSLVRHPIYTAVFINYIALLLLRYSLTTAILVAVGIFLFMVKSIMEERFLQTDPEYSRYMARVRRRWIPWIL